MKIREIVTTTVMVLAIIAVSTTTASALSCSGDICVDPTGWWRDGGAFNPSTTPIQAAVDNANAGETICVAAGSYTENVDIATSHLTLRGAGADLVTVNAASSSDHVFYVTADYVNISGFTVTGATGSSNAGINLDSADRCNISDNNAISNNYCGILWVSCNDNMLANNTANLNGGYGILLSSSSNNTLVGNIATNSNYYDGICLYDSSNNTLVSNTANSNNNYGIWLYDSRDNTLVSNNASSNRNYGIRLEHSNNNMLASNPAISNGWYGIQLVSSSNNTLLNNTASSNNYDGIRLSSSSNNTLANNNASSNSAHGIYLFSSSNNTFTSNTASNNNYGIRLYSSSNNTFTRNRCSNNVNDGIHLQSSCDNDVTCNLMQNNTDSGIRLTIGSTGNTITWNNIVANGELQTDGSRHYQFRNSQSDSVDAINNFWGSGMNNDTIDASIYDDEEGQAEVIFDPFETEPVPCAPAPISEESPAFTTVDAVIALEMAVGSCPLDLHWDVSDDGHVTSLDALMIVMGT